VFFGGSGFVGAFWEAERDRGVGLLLALARDDDAGADAVRRFCCCRSLSQDDPLTQHTHAGHLLLLLLLLDHHALSLTNQHQPLLARAHPQPTYHSPQLSPAEQQQGPLSCPRGSKRMVFYYYPRAHVPGKDDYLIYIGK
jgi:hypothetical protein